MVAPVVEGGSELTLAPDSVCTTPVQPCLCRARSGLFCSCVTGAVSKSGDGDWLILVGLLRATGQFMHTSRTQVLNPEGDSLGSQDPEGRSSESLHIDLCRLGACSLPRRPLNDADQFEMETPADDKVEKERHGLEHQMDQSFRPASQCLGELGALVTLLSLKMSSCDRWLPGAESTPALFLYLFSYEGSSHLQTTYLTSHPLCPRSPGPQALIYAPRAVRAVSEARLACLPEPSCCRSEMLQSSQTPPRRPSFLFKFLTHRDLQEERIFTLLLSLCVLCFLFNGDFLTRAAVTAVNAFFKKPWGIENTIFPLPQ